MPDSAGSSTTIARFCLAVFLAVAAPGHLAHAVGNAQASPEQDGGSTERPYSLLDGDITLTGFPCGGIERPASTVFNADPDYRETPLTVGVQVMLEEVSALAGPSARGRMHDMPAGEMRTPLSAKVSRMLTQYEISAAPGDDEMQDVFVPEASMGVADLVALCTP